MRPNVLVGQSASWNLLRPHSCLMMSLSLSLSPSLCNKPMVGDGIAKETISEMKFAHFCGFLPFPDFCRFRGTKRNERVKPSCPRVQLYYGPVVLGFSCTRVFLS